MWPSKKLRLESGSFVTLQDENVTCRDEDERRKKGTRTELLDLNDDCLYAIFENVSIIDLCSIAETSVHLKDIGCQIFKKKYKICSFNKATAKTTIEARKLFQTFGGLMTELDINFSLCPKASEIMDAVMRYCTTLDTLKLRSYDIPDNQEIISSTGNFFQNLKELHIGCLSIEGFENQFSDDLITPNGNLMDLFVECSSLTHLKVENSENLNRIIFESAFPQLQYFDYFGACIHFLIDGFIYRHKNLKSISFNPCEDDNDDDLPALKVMAANCKKLEKLSFSFGSSSLQADYEQLLKKLSRLKRLRHMQMDCIGEHVNMFARILPSFRDTLEVLEISGADHGRGIIPAISELKKLRFLRLEQCSILDDLTPLGELTELSGLSIVQIEKNLKLDLVELVGKLINLMKLHVSVGEFKMCNNTYNQLVDVVERRQNAKNRSLQIYCRTTDDFIDLKRTSVKVMNLNIISRFERFVNNHQQSS